MTRTFWAHSDPDGLPPEHPKAKWQRLSEHLDNAARIAGELAAAARPDDDCFRQAAEAAGRLHDFGKYTDCFQNMILTGKGRCPHSAHGAVIANDTHNRDVAFAIAGHHAGIPDGRGGTGTLEVRLREARADAESLEPRAASDLPGLATLFQSAATPRRIEKEAFDLHTRILFSCLVDADRLDSGGRVPLFGPLLASERLAELLEHIEPVALADEIPTAIGRQTGHHAPEKNRRQRQAAVRGNRSGGDQGRQRRNRKADLIHQHIEADDDEPVVTQCE